ncbi:uncharacterized protein [Nicotiana sylvestris]|uniref:uncharacterized protein n=1 Tax=Nicotiana sylvestris TaxID=4096 RepID=UPI00388CD8BE
MGSLAFIPTGERPLAVDVQALANYFDKFQHHDARDVTIADDGVLRMQGRICVLNIDERWVKDALDKVKLIQERLRMAQSRQKSYGDRKGRDVSYMVGEKVVLKVSPMKVVMRFEKKGKLSPRFIGPFKVH